MTNGIRIFDNSEYPVIAVDVVFGFRKSIGNQTTDFHPSPTGNPDFYAVDIMNELVGYANNSLRNVSSQDQIEQVGKFNDHIFEYRFLGVNSLSASNINSVAYFNTSPPSSTEALRVMIRDNHPTNTRRSGSTSYCADYIDVNNLANDITNGGYKPWEWARLINHELGHILGLEHAFHCQNFISDMTPELQCGGPSASGCDPAPNQDCQTQTHPGARLDPC